MVMAILDCIDLLKKNSSTQILKVKYTDIFFTRQQLLANKSYLKILGRSRLICWTTSLLKLGEKNQNNNCNIYKTVSYLNFYMYFFFILTGVNESRGRIWGHSYKLGRKETRFLEVTILRNLFISFVINFYL